VIEQAGFDEEIELISEVGRVVLRPAHIPRADWDRRFAQKGRSTDDELLLPERLINEFDRKDWR
jgi:hypothetical protein